jgi:hypothetical protein
MTNLDPVSTEHFLAALGREIRRQANLLEQLRDIALAQEWEYLLVHIHARKERWYEYYANGEKLPDLDNKAVYQVLNHLGGQGWELVAVMPGGDFYFKRRRI